MPVIYLETIIKSTIEICFDLSRSIDLHKVSTVETNERAIDGVTSGLINMGEFVTWEATHFGIKQKLKTRITGYNRPFHFRDEQEKGAFKYFVHDHYFESKDNIVIMKDSFEFESPFYILGKIVSKLILANYMRNFLVKRNNIIKEYAETDNRKMILYEEN